MKNKDMPASPTPYMDLSQGGGELHCDQQGFTKREAAALSILQGLLSNSRDTSAYTDVVSSAIGIADDFFKKLEETK